METYYIVTYTRHSGTMRQTKGILCDSSMIDVQATLACPKDPPWCNYGDKWEVTEIEPVDCP